MKREKQSKYLCAWVLLSCASAAAQTIDEVQVTAQRRAQDLQSVPVAVSAFDADQIDLLRWTSPDEIAAQVPNMQVSAPYGDVQPLFAIRGISMVDYSPSQSGPIGLYTDEGYLAPSYTHGMNMFDLERIEVLRGPQGTLYGKNTTGGAINLISVTPDVAADLAGSLTAGVGNFGLRNFDGNLEGTLVEGKLSGRIAIDIERDDGYWDNVGGPTMAQTDSTSGRLTLNYEPRSHISAILKLTVGKSDGRATPPRITGTAGPGITLAGRPSNPERHAGQINHVGRSEVDMTLANLRLSYEWDSFSLVSVSNYVDADYLQVTDTDGTSASLLAVDWGATSKSFAQDLRLVSNLDGRVDFIAGLFYSTDDTDTDILHTEMFSDPAVGPTLNALAIGAAPINADLSNHLFVLADALPQVGQADRRFDVERATTAIYGDVAFQVTDHLGLNFGLRYTDESVTRDYINYSRLDANGDGIGSWVPGNLLTPQFNALGIDSPFVTYMLSQSVPIPAGTFLDGPYTLDSGERRTRQAGETSGNLTVSWKSGQSSTIYGSWSRGFRSGNFNNGLVYSDQPDQNGTYARPEFVDALEAGFKGSFANNRVRLNAALFRYDYEDQQFINQIGLSAQLVNAGGTRIDGAEFELAAQASENLQISFGLGLLDAEYTKLTLPRLTTALDPLDTIDLAGNVPVSAPDTNVNYSIGYTMLLPRDWSARFGVNGNYVSEQWFSAYNELDGNADIRQDAYQVHNARVSFARNDGRLEFSLWGRNIFDEDYTTFAINLRGLGFNYFMEARPRTYGLEFTYRTN